MVVEVNSHSEDSYTSPTLPVAEESKFLERILNGKWKKLGLTSQEARALSLKSFSESSHNEAVGAVCRALNSMASIDSLSQGQIKVVCKILNAYLIGESHLQHQACATDILRCMARTSMAARIAIADPKNHVVSGKALKILPLRSKTLKPSEIPHSLRRTQTIHHLAETTREEIQHKQKQYIQYFLHAFVSNKIYSDKTEKANTLKRAFKDMLKPSKGEEYVQKKAKQIKILLKKFSSRVSSVEEEITDQKLKQAVDFFIRNPQLESAKKKSVEDASVVESVAPAAEKEVSASGGGGEASSLEESPLHQLVDEAAASIFPFLKS